MYPVPRLGSRGNKSTRTLIYKSPCTLFISQENCQKCTSGSKNRCSNTIPSSVAQPAEVRSQLCTPPFRGQNTETTELSVHPAQPSQIIGKIKRSTEVKDLSVFIFIQPFLINMHNKYFWISTLLGVPRWESVMRIYNLVESIYYSIFVTYKHCHKDWSPTMPTHWAKHLHLKGLVSANTADYEQKRKQQKRKIMQMTNSVKSWKWYSELLKSNPLIWLGDMLCNIGITELFENMYNFAFKKSRVYPRQSKAAVW